MHNKTGIFDITFRNDFGKEVQETFNLIKENPDYSAVQLSEIVGKTSRTIENHIAKLKNANAIIRKGAKLGGYWKINYNMKST